MRPGPKRRDRGFTLIELGVVVLIIGILMTFLLAASWEGVRRAEERGTQALILKLDAALTDRVEALTRQRPPANLAHRYLSMTAIPGPGSDPPRFLVSEDRARLIARIDYLKRELPDVFFVQDDALYPLNFAGMPFWPQSASPISGSTAGSASLGAYFRYILPLGHGVSSINETFNDEGVYLSGPAVPTTWWGLGGNSSAPPGEGIFGASYSAMGALTRQLGYPKRGYNGSDDDGNGLIDERTAAEFGMTESEFNTLNANLINPRLAAHKHNTARSEMLYAILVGGAGPLGSAFSPDDFTDREVRDTDGDGLPEFIDAWGRPLQFYRWPFYYMTDYGSRQSLQKGSTTYNNRIETRDQNPLDPNQLLVSPAWWVNLFSATLPDSSAQMSPRANLFQQHFFSIIDPSADIFTATTAQGQLWDRNGFYKRRAYFFKPLILSSGPDRQLGVGSFGVQYGDAVQTDAVNYQVDGASAPLTVIPTASRDAFSARLNLIEGQASRSNPFGRVPGAAGTLTIDATGPGARALYHQPDDGNDPITPFFHSGPSWAIDDIANQTINAPGSGAR